MHKVQKGNHAPFVIISKSEDCKVHRHRDVNRGCLLWDSLGVVNQTMRIFMNSVERIRSSPAGDGISSGGWLGCQSSSATQ